MYLILVPLWGAIVFVCMMNFTLALLDFSTGKILCLKQALDNLLAFLLCQFPIT